MSAAYLHRVTHTSQELKNAKAREKNAAKRSRGECLNCSRKASHGVYCTSCYARRMEATTKWRVANQPHVREYQREWERAKAAKRRAPTKPSEETKEALMGEDRHFSQRGLRCGRCGITMGWKDSCRWSGNKLMHNACYWMIVRVPSLA